jgi:hypothetical protein
MDSTNLGSYPNSCSRAMSAPKPKSTNPAKKLKPDTSEESTKEEKRMMKSVRSAKGPMWTSHLAMLLLERADFAVMKGKKRTLAAYSDEARMWILDDGYCNAVYSVIKGALAKLGLDMGHVLPDNDDGDDDDSDSGGVPGLEIPLHVYEELRKTLLPQLLVMKGRFLSTAKDTIFCADDVCITDADPKTARAATTEDHCTRKTGFTSSALKEEPQGFKAWHDAWKANKTHRVIDFVVGSAALHGTPVQGELLVTKEMRSFLEATVGGYELCAPGSAFQAQFDPPSGTKPEFLAHAAFLATKDIPDNTWQDPTMGELAQLATRTPPDVHACHILYSCLRSNEAARASPLSHFVKMKDVKTMVQPAGIYKSKDDFERLLQLTFTPPVPEFRNGHGDRSIDAYCWVLTGVEKLEISDKSTPPDSRSWTPKPMVDTDGPLAALMDPEE